jgi:tetratricopeptide (TPR) repeat protein
LGFLVRHKKWVAASLGALVGLLVFAVGAVALVVRSSPDYHLRKQFGQQMELAGEAYRAGRYEEAARAFGEACRLKPDSAEAQRRYQDALVMAGYPATPALPAGAVGERVASASPANPYPPMPPVWVGPRPASAQPGYPTPSPASPIPPPPPDEPLPPPTRGDAPLPPPIPTGPGTEPVTVPPTVPTATPGTGIGVAAEPEPAPAPPPRTKAGRIVIQRHESPPRTTPPAPAPPSGAALRAEAERLHRGGQTAQAARVYGQAEAQLRVEAAAGGPGAAAKLSAAASCARAKQLCESRDH